MSAQSFVQTSMNRALAGKTRQLDDPVRMGRVAGNNTRHASRRKRTRAGFFMPVMLAYMLSTISPGSRWREDLLALLGQHPKVDLDAMGFPENWHQSPVLERQ